MTPKHYAIAKDYYTTTMSNKAIAKKHRVAPTSVSEVSSRIAPEVFDKRDWCVIKIERKNMHQVLEFLGLTEIGHEIPEKFELTEIIESKI